MSSNETEKTAGVVDTTSPARHGWRKCAVCGTWRPLKQLVQEAQSLVLACEDRLWCIARARGEN
jgi:hypothetical protein